MISKHATFDKSVLKLMRRLKVGPRVCKYCKGEYYPYKTDTREEWLKTEYCSSICKANDNSKFDEEKVRWRSKKKYTCKRNKGEHEYGQPVIKYKPKVRYIYKTKENYILDSDKLHPEYKFIRAEVSIGLETRCIHCGKKCLTFLRQKLK